MSAERFCLFNLTIKRKLFHAPNVHIYCQLMLARNAILIYININVIFYLFIISILNHFSIYFSILPIMHWKNTDVKVMLFGFIINVF